MFLVAVLFCLPLWAQETYKIPVHPNVGGYGIEAKYQEIGGQRLDPLSIFEPQAKPSEKALTPEVRTQIEREISNLDADTFIERQAASQAILHWLEASLEARVYITEASLTSPREVRSRIRAALLQTPPPLRFGSLKTLIQRSIRESASTQKLKAIFEKISAELTETDKELVLEARKRIEGPWKTNSDIQVIHAAYGRAVAQLINDASSVSLDTEKQRTIFTYEDETYNLATNSYDGHQELLYHHPSGNYAFRKECIPAGEIFPKYLLAEKADLPDICYGALLHSFPEVKEYMITVNYFFPDQTSGHYQDPYEGPESYLVMVLPELKEQIEAARPPKLLSEAEAWLR